MTRSGAIAYSLVVLAAVILVLGSVSKAASGVDGEGERTMHLPEKNSRQFGEMMVFALSQRNNSLALSRQWKKNSLDSALGLITCKTRPRSSMM